MAKIIYVMGKSASGKDTIFQELLRRNPELKTITLYTTRPMRDGEAEGVEYHFTTEEQLEHFAEEGKLIESRTYQTIRGPWSYFTVDDGQIDLAVSDYLVIGTLESYRQMQKFFGSEVMLPIYLTVGDRIRLERALQRENLQKTPNYAELCRRYLADEVDFSAEKLKECGIQKSFDNTLLGSCLAEIEAEISKR